MKEILLAVVVMAAAVILCLAAFASTFEAATPTFSSTDRLQLRDDLKDTEFAGGRFIDTRTYRVCANRRETLFHSNGNITYGAECWK